MISPRLNDVKFECTPAYFTFARTSQRKLLSELTVFKAGFENSKVLVISF